MTFLGQRARVRDPDRFADDTPKRGALVSVGDIPIDVPGVGRTLTAKRQAHHFTTLDQARRRAPRCRACCSRGCAPKPTARDRASWCSAIRSRRSCGSWPFTTTTAAPGDGFKSRCAACLGAWCRSPTKDATSDRFVNSLIADSGEYWWDVKQPDQSSLWESKIVLGERFFHEVITNPVPLDMHVLHAVKRSPLGLDLVSVARLSDVRPHVLAAPDVEAALPAVRCGPGEGERQEHRQRFPHRLPPGVEENPNRVAGPRLSAGQGRARRLAVPSAHRAGAAPAQGGTAHARHIRGVRRHFIRAHLGVGCRDRRSACRPILPRTGPDIPRSPTTAVPAPRLRSATSILATHSVRAVSIRPAASYRVSRRRSISAPVSFCRASIRRCSSA